MEHARVRGRSAHEGLFIVLASLALALHAGTSAAADPPAATDAAASSVKIKKWKLDPVELYDQPGGKVVASRPAAEMPLEAVRTGQGWLRLSVDGKEYFVEASQARTDLKLSGKPKCEQLEGATGHAASRGIGEDGCTK